MDNFTFYTPTRYIFGRGAEDKAGTLSAELLGRKVMIVIGGGSVVRSGLLGRVEESLKGAGVEYVILKGVQPNPTDDLVYVGIEEARRESVSGILAVGGGSVIDTAKAIALGAIYDGDFWDFYSGAAVPQKALPVGVVLTIPAAGSEGSGNSVITRRDGMLKLGTRTDSVLRPKFALMNPELTFTLPPEQTAAGIADMMAHIFERYMSPTRDVQLTDRLSEGLLKAIIEEAPKVMANPTDYQARANIMWAGTLAHNGVCGTGRVEDWTSHAMEHELSALYNVTHGAGLAVIIPAWVTYMADVAPEKPAELARNVFNVNIPDDRAAALACAAALCEFFASIGLPTTMRELGINNPDVPLLVERLHAVKGHQFGGYRLLDPAATTAIYTLAL
ncbi:MAG: iron-containing alcohol dehydrogenase [Muribaculaceae bacterium]|nr:iron-containing alcohol dehydrogenase [Muribaculaceae bacterium]